MGVILKIAFRNMKRRKLRYILTTVTLVIGVALFGGVSIASDSFNVMFINDIDRRMGTADILVRTSDIDDDWFDPDELDDVFEDIEGIDSFTYRISGYSVYVSATEEGDESDSERTAVYGIDPESSEEAELGGDLEILDSDVDGETIEELLDNTDDETDDRVIVITESLEIRLGKDFEAGDYVWILPVDGEDLGLGIDPADTGTWLKYTVVAIVRDLGEARDFDPDTPSDFSSPSRGSCLFCNIENAHELVDGENDVDEDSYNLAVIGVDDINNVAEIVENLEDELGEDDWSVSDLKTESIEDINNSIEIMRTMFSMFAVVSLILSIILILNIFNIIKEEQEYETGMLQAIGASKSETFKTFLAQGVIMGVIGGIIGTICAYFMSYLIFYLVIESLSGMPGEFGEYFAGLEIVIVLLPLTLVMTFAVGVISCVLASIYPSWKASRKPLIECLNPLAQKAEREKRRVKRSILFALIFIFLIAYGTYLLFQIQVAGRTGESSASQSSISMVAPTLILLGLIGLMSLAVGPLTRGVITLFSPYLKQTKLLTKKNVLRHRKRTVLTFSMIALTTGTLIGLSVFLSSVSEGANTSVQNIIGCDIRVFSADTPRDFEENLLEVDDVDDVMGVTYVNARIWDEDEEKWIGRKLLEEDWDQSVTTHVLDTEKIDEHMTNTIVLAPERMTIAKMMDELSEEDTVIITDKEAERFDVDVGDDLIVKFSVGYSYPNLNDARDRITDDAYEHILKKELEVIAIIGELEGFAGMELIGDVSNIYNIFISWENYENYALFELPGGGTDIIFKHTSQTGDSELDAMQPDWFNFSDIEAVLQDISGIEDYTARMDSFTLTNVSGALNPEFSQVIGIRTDTFGNLKSDSLFGQHTIKQAASGNESFTMEEILNQNPNLCVIDETFDQSNNVGIGDTVKIFPQEIEPITIYAGKTFPLNNTKVNMVKGKQVPPFNDEDFLTYSDNFNMTFESDREWLELDITLDLTLGGYPVFYFKAVNITLECAVNSTIDSLVLEAFNYYNDSYDLLGDINTMTEKIHQLTFHPGHSYIDPYTNLLYLKIIGYDSTLGTTNFSLNIDWLNYDMMKSTYMMASSSLWPQFTVAAIIEDPKLYNTERYGWRAGSETLIDVSGTENAIYINYEKARDLIYVNYTGSNPSNDMVNFVLIHCDSPEIVEETYDDLCNLLKDEDGWSIGDLKTYILTLRTNVIGWFIWIEEREDDEKVLEDVIDCFEEEGYIIYFAFTKTFLTDIFRSQLNLTTSISTGILIFTIVISMIGLALHCLLTTMARRREIGMLRSIGLSKKGIIRTISGETLIVAFLGVLIGIITGMIEGALMVASMPETSFLKVTYTVPYLTIAILILVTVITAITSSRYPSRWAANINIIDAVRTR
ncbi:MAG: ABC transporter permease [Promethearchaeota archaeon]